MARLNLIFDFDGTLADTWPLVADITHRITHVRLPSEAKLGRLRSLPLLEAVRRLGGKIWDMPFLALFTRRAMLPHMQEVAAFRGVVPMVQALHQEGHRLFVLTSNSELNVEVFLKQQGIGDCFEVIKHCSVFLKSSGLKRLLREHNLAASRSFYIANEAADIDMAQSAGVRTVAVTWSGQDRAKLSAAQPFEIVDRPRELLQLFGEATQP